MLFRFFKPLSSWIRTLSLPRRDSDWRWLEQASSTRRLRTWRGAEPPQLALLYEKANRQAEAIEIYRKFSDNPAVRERMGELLLEGGDAGKAIPELEASVTKSPTVANRYALATAYMQTGEYGKAESLLQAALTQEPQNNDLRLTYGRALRQQKKYAPGGGRGFLAAKAKPERAETWSDLAGVLVLLEQYEQALAALDRGKALERRETRALLPACNRAR